MITNDDFKYLERCVALAEMALIKGDAPFGSVLVSAEGNVLYEGHNQIASGDHTQHPEFAIARWAAEHLSPDERKQATVYTSGEHCPMCAAAHGWVGLGRIVYASSSKQLTHWLTAMNIAPGPVKPLAIEDVLLDAHVEGPVPALAQKIQQLHHDYYTCS